MMRNRMVAMVGAAALALAGCGEGLQQGPTGPDDAGLSHTTASSGPDFVWVDQTGPGLGQSDDDCDQMSLGFSFQFYGQSYSSIWVNSNGNATFVSCNTDYSTPTVPDAGHVLVAPLYGDFDPSVSGDVYFNVIGQPGQRRAVLTWHVVPEYSGTPGANTFQAILYEGTNEIVFGYWELATDGINWTPTGQPMNVGISAGDGTNFTRSASGGEIPGLVGTNICYVPDGSGGYSEYMPAAFTMSNGVPHCSGADADGAGTDDPEQSDDTEYDDETGFPIGSPPAGPPPNGGGASD